MRFILSYNELQHIINPDIRDWMEIGSLNKYANGLELTRLLRNKRFNEEAPIEIHKDMFSNIIFIQDDKYKMSDPVKDKRRKYHI